MRPMRFLIRGVESSSRMWFHLHEIDTLYWSGLPHPSPRTLFSNVVCPHAFHEIFTLRLITLGDSVLLTSTFPLQVYVLFTQHVLT